MVVMLSREVTHASKIAALKKHPTNILREEKHIHGIIFMLPKPNKALPTAKY